MPVFRQAYIWIFGEEGEILTDSATQAIIVASSILVTGTMLISPLIADLAVTFGVSEGYAGWMVAAFTVTTAVTLPIVGALTDKIGRRSVLTAGLVVFGLSGAAIAVVEWFEAILVLRAIQGVGYACSMPVILTVIGDLYKGSRETTVQGMRVTVNSVMNAGVPLLAGFVFVYSWRYPFVIYLLAVPSALWVWQTLPRVETRNDWSFRTYFREIAGFVSDAKIAMLMLSFTFRFIVFYGLLTYISVLAIREAGLAVVAVGALLTVQNVIKTVCSAQAGRLALRMSTAFLSFASFLFVALGTVLMGLIPTASMLVLGIVVWGIGDGVLAPCQKSLVNQIAPAEYRGGAMTSALVFQNVGKFVGPVLLGVTLTSVGPASSFVLLGLFGGGLGVATLFAVWLWTDL